MLMFLPSGFILPKHIHISTDYFSPVYLVLIVSLNPIYSGLSCMAVLFTVSQVRFSGTQALKSVVVFFSLGKLTQERLLQHPIARITAAGLGIDLLGL